MKTSTLLWVLAGVFIVLGLGWYFFATSNSPTVSITNNPQTGDAAAAGGAAPEQPPMAATVTYDGTSFTPATVTIARGGAVTFVDTAGVMWVASDPHPIHNGYDGTTQSQHCIAGYTGSAPFDQCGAGQSFTFIFTRTGSWGYHDHRNHTATGTVVVE